MCPEIPFFMHHYEIFRDQEWSREHWMQELIGGMDPIPEFLSSRNILQYSRNLALTDGQLYPGIYNLLAAANNCAGDGFALRLYERATSYPGADQDSNCEIRFCYDYNLKPLVDVRILEIKADLDRTPEWLCDRMNGQDDRKQHPLPFGVFQFTRTAHSLQCEKNFMRYLKHRFPHLEPNDEFTVEEFSCGFKDGIDERETIRHAFQDRIYVKERQYQNNAVYVVDYGGNPTWCVYFNTNYHMIGAACRHDATTHTWVCFTAFLNPPRPMEELLSEVDLINPRASCLDLAMEYADHVFLFTDKEKRPLTKNERSSKIHVFDIAILPSQLREAMRWFHVAS